MLATWFTRSSPWTATVQKKTPPLIQRPPVIATLQQQIITDQVIISFIIKVIIIVIIFTRVIASLVVVVQSILVVMCWLVVTAKICRPLPTCPPGSWAEAHHRRGRASPTYCASSLPTHSMRRPPKRDRVTVMWARISAFPAQVSGVLWSFSY